MEKRLWLLILSVSIYILYERPCRSLCLAEGDGGIEKTLAIIKPDGVEGNHTEEIKRIILAAGFVIAAEKIVQLDEDAVRIFYAEHSHKEFFPSLIEFMTSGPVLTMILEKEGAITQWRALIGPTDARKARVSHPNSIRAICGLDSQRNCIHGSDSPESVAREIAFFFGENKSEDMTLATLTLYCTGCPKLHC